MMWLIMYSAPKKAAESCERLLPAYYLRILTWREAIRSDLVEEAQVEIAESQVQRRGRRGLSPASASTAWDLGRYQRLSSQLRDGRLGKSVASIIHGGDSKPARCQGYDLACVEERRVAYTLGAAYPMINMTSLYAHSPSAFFVVYGWARGRWIPERGKLTRPSMARA